MAKAAWKGPRKRRSREHVISEMSVNFLERQILRRGHQLMRPPQFEYGIDGYMLHFDDDGQVENGLVYFQLKATDDIKFVDKGRAVSVRVKFSDLRYWYSVTEHPVILIIYDAVKHRAFWVDVQAYVDEHKVVDDATITIRIPRKNKLDVWAIDKIRELALTHV